MAVEHLLWLPIQVFAEKTGAPATLEAAQDVRAVAHKVGDPVFRMGRHNVGAQEVELDNVKGL